MGLRSRTGGKSVKAVLDTLTNQDNRREQGSKTLHPPLPDETGLGMRKWIFAVLAVYVLLFIVPLGVRPLVIPDETRYAEIPREMIETGDWVVPRLNGIRYFEKPVMGYWLSAVSIVLFGENEFAARLPAALSVGLTSLIVFLLVACRGAGKQVALIASFIYLTFAEVFGVGTFNVLDSQLTLFLTAACASFLCAFLSSEAKTRFLWLSFTGIFCGLAFLTKGFLAFAVPTLAAAPFLLLQRKARSLFSMPWIPILFAAFTCLPWAVLIAQREPTFWHYFFWVEHVRRFFSDNPQHPQPFWYFAALLPLLSFPWSLFAPAAAAWYRKTKGRDILIRFSLCWFVFPFLFFSASKGKLATYVLPCLPPLAILIANGLNGYLEGGRRRLFSFFALSSSALAAAGAVVVIILVLFPFSKLTLFGPSELWKQLLIAFTLTTWAILAFLAGRLKERKTVLVLIAAAPLLAYFSTHFILPEGIEARKAPGAFIERHGIEIPEGAVVVSDEALAASVCWYLKRSDVHLLLDGGELEHGLTYPDSVQRLLNLDGFKSLTLKSDAGGVVLFADSRFYARTALPPPKEVKTEGRFTIAIYNSTK